MTSNRITDVFLDKLKEDSVEYRTLETSQYNLTEKKNAIRSLMNVRMPRKISVELLEAQNQYLQEELIEKGVVSLSEIPTIQGIDIAYLNHLSIWQGDITRLAVGAIVNAANSHMLGCFTPCHKCIDNAIHSAAGMQLRDECNHIMTNRRMQYGKEYTEPTGTATLTKAYNLPCDYVIHTVGPIVYGELNDSLREDLRNCYENVLKCCVENKIRTVAFCCISTGEFHFPNNEAAKIAIETVTGFLKAHPDSMERIIFNVFKDNDATIYHDIILSYNSSI